MDTTHGTRLVSIYSLIHKLINDSMESLNRKLVFIQLQSCSGEIFTVECVNIWRICGQLKGDGFYVSSLLAMIISFSSTSSVII